MRVRIRHESLYHYPRPADFGPHIIRLRPGDHTRARVLSYNLQVEPKCEVRWQRDPNGNRVARASFPAEEKFEALRLVVDAAFEIRPVNPFDFFVDDRCQELPFVYPDGLESELGPYLQKPVMTPQLGAFIEDNRARGYVTDYLVALNSAVAKRVRYIIRNEPGVQSSEETLTIGSGSCRDSAVLLVDVLRAQGLAARFVSGYLVQLADEGNIPNEAKGVSNDVVDLHAWAEVYIPGAGWIGLDGTSGLLAGEGHIPLAGTAEPRLASPVEGTASEPATDVQFKMEIVRLGHEPRPRRPYTDACWEKMLDLGRTADRHLDGAGLTLTMGGEPTWTSRLHPHEEEWNGKALGPTKWKQGLLLSKELLHRLAPKKPDLLRPGTGGLASEARSEAKPSKAGRPDLLRPGTGGLASEARSEAKPSEAGRPDLLRPGTGGGGLLLHRMGKHYPGESLPRWVMHLVWRPDGEPVWRDLRWLDFDLAGYTAANAGTTDASMLDRAEAFARALALRLGLRSSDTLQPGYEDPWVFIRQEEDLPHDVDPLKADLDDSEDRRRLARVLGRGLGTAVGYALPLNATHEGFVSSRWTFRRGHLFLIAGDAPMGLRLPLDRIGGKPFPQWSQDPSQKFVALPSHASLEARSTGSSPGLASGFPTDIDAVVRTALCVEPRGKSLAVFLPPMPTTEQFLLLVAAVENTARALEQPVALEGYGPPSDPRMRSCLVTPDPGVIEVNLPVTRTFDEYASLMQTITDAARHAGLTTEKYQLDGREVGSGGGHHLTLGGPTTFESPFLKRPELFANLLRYIQNHPALSYLFSSIFVGPTSQAPRVDEARHDALYELEIALAQVPHLGSSRIPPWLTDRLFRNLLTDVSGNTHRTEVSIDKLYDPMSAAGRQGLLEFRAFEMPAHERMATAQMLLVRSLVAMLANSNYERPLIRWGSQLHDRFMLPHFLWKDLVDIFSDLNRAGLRFEEEMYLPFLDFKCPVMGRLDIEDCMFEIRTALEPWLVLGEEGASVGTVRYVDSSVERIQIKVDGLIEGRHAVLVNGHRLPLRPTGRAGEQVAGVRFRAWQPPHCLHPNIGVHHPLRFDLVDTWGQRSLGAATYHVWHPEGRAFDDPPLTAFEAAARRAQRFTSEGHAPYPVVPSETSIHPEQPYTLDLRRFDPGK